MSPTAWDALQWLELSSPETPQPAVQWSMVGSGPYYTQTINTAIGYVLKANPAYSAPTGCAGQPGCEPLPGTYQGTVNVYWDEDDSQGIANYQAGQADLAGIQLPAHVSTLKTLVGDGKVDLTYIPTISIFVMPYNLNFNVSVTNTIPNNPGTTNVPGDFFSQIGLRQFITDAFPYATVNTSLLQAGGISTGFGYGGAIPKYLGNYYSYNISWPDTDPITNPNVVGGAAWWWAQANNASSPYYDSELAACTTSNPCTFPIIGLTGSTYYDGAIPDLIGEIESLTGGRLQPYTFTPGLYIPPYGCYCNGFTLWNLGWAPDYPDPTDYVTPMYLPASTYTFGDAVAPELALPQFNEPSCPYVGNWSNPSDAWKALVYYHNLQELPNGCQGVAYNISTAWYVAAASLALGPQRTLDYQMANQLDYLLALCIWNFQETFPTTYAPWIDGATLNTNVMIGGGGVNTWYTVGYTSGVKTATFAETGLASGTLWSVSVGGTTLSSTTTSISVQLATGTYTYMIGFAAGYTVSPATGTVDLTSGGANVSVTYTAFTSGEPATFSATGLVTGTGWSVLLTASASVNPPVSGLGLISTQAESITISVPQGNYSYQASGAIGYSVSGQSGTITVGASGASQVVVYTPTFGFTYAIVLTETGLVPGATWTATVIGQTQSTTAPTLTFFVQNGTYRYLVTVPGWTATPSSGTFVVNGTDQSQGTTAIAQTLSFLRTSYTITFVTSGLPTTAASWSAAVNGETETGSGTTPRLVFTFVNDTNVASNFTFVVTPPVDYTVSPEGGTLAFGPANLVINLTFTSTLGELTLTGLPTSGYNLWVNGVQVVTDGTVGSYTRDAVPAGTVSYEVVADGYYPYFNNVTVTGGQTTTVPLARALTPVATGSPYWNSFSTLAYLLIAVLGIVVLVVALAWWFHLGRRPPKHPHADAGPAAELPPRSPPSQ